MRLRAQCEGAVVRCHDEISAGCLFPEQCGSEVNSVERSQFGWHRLSGPIEDSGIDLDEFE